MKPNFLIPSFTTKFSIIPMWCVIWRASSFAKTAEATSIFFSDGGGGFFTSICVLEEEKEEEEEEEEEGARRVFARRMRNPFESSATGSYSSFLGSELVFSLDIGDPLSSLTRSTLVREVLEILRPLVYRRKSSALLSTAMPPTVA
jgi:hypothetical protein